MRLSAARGIFLGANMAWSLHQALQGPPQCSQDRICPSVWFPKACMVWSLRPVRTLSPYTHTHTRAHTHTHKHTCTYMTHTEVTSVHVCIRTHPCAYSVTHACTHTHLCTCVYISAHTHACTPTPTHAHAHTPAVLCRFPPLAALPCLASSCSWDSAQDGGSHTPTLSLSSLSLRIHG